MFFALSTLGCAGSTSPISTAAELAALQLDSIAKASCSGGSGYRCQMMAIAIQAEALGAAPVPIRLNTVGAPQTWYAVGFDNATSGFVTHLYYVIVYSDPQFTNAIELVILVNQDTVLGQANTAFNGILAQPTTSQAGLTAGSFGTPCHATPGINVRPLADCHIGTATVSAMVVSQPVVNSQTVLDSISIAPQVVAVAREEP